MRDRREKRGKRNKRRGIMELELRDQGESRGKETR
jgi:hypothetical protein